VPTRRGWTLLIAALPLAIAGRLFGLVELYVLAVGAVALSGGALAFVRWRQVNVDAVRTLHPPRVHAGASSRVDLEVHNASPRRTPVLSVRDPFARGWRWARFLVAPLHAGARSRAAYRLPTDQRGIFEIGPLEIAISDPFGLATTSSKAAGVTTLTVYPAIERVEPLPTAQGHDPMASSDQRSAMIGVGDEFYALRPYEVGDDTRRVHWPSTARTGELMIRQDEMPWQGRATILLDVRAGVHNEQTLEAGVSAAASLFEASRRRHSQVRLVSTDGTDSGWCVGAQAADAVLEYLAGVQLGRENRLAAVAANLRRPGSGGSLAIITTADSPTADLEVMARLGQRFGRVVMVVLEKKVGQQPQAAPAVDTVVRVPQGGSFAAAWNRTMTPIGASR
jgi:uncharacterized protein (DUF58 family)